MKKTLEEYAINKNYVERYDVEQLFRNDVKDSLEKYRLYAL